MTLRNADTTARLLQAVAEPTRVQIVAHLAAGPLHVGAIAARVGAKMVNVSHHLGVMAHAGLLSSRKEGRRVIYALDPAVWRGEDRAIDTPWCKIRLPAGAPEPEPATDEEPT